MKKSLSYLIESELEKAEVILAAKAISDQVQKMAETMAKIEGDDLIPLGETLRTMFGGDAAANFSKNVSDQLRDLTQKMLEASGAISDAISSLEGGETGSMAPATGDDNLSTMDDNALSPDMNTDDSDKAEDGDGDLSFDMGGDDEQALSDGDEDQDTDFEGSPAGREMKNSFESVDPDRLLVREYSKMLKEGETASVAATKICESYGISINDLIEIMEGLKK